MPLAYHEHEQRTKLQRRDLIELSLIKTEATHHQAMFSSAQVVEFLLECHGGTRDVTFTPVPRVRLEAFLQWLRKHYQIESATDQAGADCSSLMQGHENLSLASGFIHALLRAPGRLLPHLQLFIDWETPEQEYLVELSFFPEEIDLAQFSIESFRTEIDQWQALLQAEDYFVRQENASWTLYDSLGLGVIYTRKLPPLP